MNSCRYKRATCEESVKKNKEFEFEMIVDAVSWNGNNIKIDGKSPKTDKEVHFFDIDGWYFTIGDKFQIGDTIIKKKGESIYKVYKKNEIWTLKYTCDGGTDKFEDSKLER